MGVQYVCGDQGRRLETVRAQHTLNGIDYLEVLGDQAAPDIPPQRTLMVRCLRPLPDDFSRSNVRIEGGVRLDPRLNPVRVQWAYKATMIASAPADDPSILARDRTYFQNLPAPARLLVVRTSTVGDFSTYRLKLVISESDDQPPPDFDPQLCEVPFTFKVDCPSEFDCRIDLTCPPERLPEPHIDYMARDYTSLRRLILDRMALITPGWRERNPADTQIALVELLAYLGDRLSYYQDAVATEAYLGTARKRVSVRRHARLLDYQMHDGCTARAWVSVEVKAGQGADGATLPERTLVLSRDEDSSHVVPPDRLIEALSSRPVVFVTLHPIRLQAGRNEIQFHTWGNLQCCLPKGATRATLRGGAELGLRAGDVLIVEEVLGADSGLAVDADRSHRQAVRLDSEPFPTTDPVDGRSVLEISWYPEDALSFPLCLNQFADGAGGFVGAGVARANVVLADHGLPVGLEWDEGLADLVQEPERLPPISVDDPVPYRPALRLPSLTFRMPYDDAEARERPAAEATRADARLAIPDVNLTDGRDTWSPQRDLLASDRFAPEFVVETESDGRAYLRFGDDVLGRQPAAGTVLEATYRVGSGLSGNVGPEALARLVTDLDGIDVVRNPLPGSGGIDPEAVEQVRQHAPQAFRTQERAVTQADYAAVAQRQPEVQRAAATRRWTGSWYTEFVAVDRRGGFPVDAAFRATMAEFLERYRMAGYDVDIDAPVFVSLDIFFIVCVKPGYFRANVKKALLDRFGTRDLPDGSRGFFHPDNLTFGQHVYLSRVVATAMEVEGVSWIDTDDSDGKPTRFRRWGQESHGELADGVIRMGRLEIARLDNDPNAPENGRIDFQMEGGL